MNVYGQYALAGVGLVLLFTCVRPYALRKWLGIALVILGFAVIIALPSFVGGIDVGIFAVSAVIAGASLFFSRTKYQA